MDEQTLTYDDVAAAAQALDGQGLPVTLGALGSALGHAALAAIQPHLTTWREQHHAPVSRPVVGLPAPLAEALAAWVEEQAHAAGSGLRETLARADQDLASLIQAHERSEQARQAASMQAADLLAEVEQLRAQLADRNAHIEQLTVELRHARDIASDALVGKAKDKLAIEGKDAQIADLRQQLERSVAVTATAADARLAAEMELVGAVTARDNLAAEVATLRQQLDANRAGARTA